METCVSVFVCLTDFNCVLKASKVQKKKKGETQKYVCVCIFRLLRGQILRGTPLCPAPYNPVLKPVYRYLSRHQSYIDSHVSLLTKTGFHASSRRSLFSEFEL
jgi:hypothetical protein